MMIIINYGTNLNIGNLKAKNTSGFKIYVENGPKRNVL